MCACACVLFPQWYREDPCYTSVRHQYTITQYVPEEYLYCYTHSCVTLTCNSYIHLLIFQLDRQVSIVYKQDYEKPVSCGSIKSHTTSMGDEVRSRLSTLNDHHSCFLFGRQHLAKFEGSHNSLHIAQTSL